MLQTEGQKQGLTKDLVNEDRSSLYGTEYYRSSCAPFPYEHNDFWLSFFGGIAAALVRSLKPRKVMDLGCAMGFLVESFWELGVEAWGIDISPYAISKVRPDLRSYCSVGSVAEPIIGTFDLITCIEVLEHVPEADAQAAIKEMCKATDTILFSSTPYDFSERTHCNVHPLIYWVKSFSSHGFWPDLLFDAGFLTQHAMLLRRGDSPVPDEVLLLFCQMLDQKNTLVKKSEEAARLAEELTKKSEEGVRLAEELTKKSEEAARLAEELAKKSEESATLVEELAKKSEESATLVEELAKKSEESATLVEELAKKFQEAATLAEEKSRAEQAFSLQIDQKESAIRDLQIAVAQREEAAQNLKATISQIRSSRSWMILEHYYRVRNKLLPEGSHRKNWVRFGWRLATHQPVSKPKLRLLSLTRVNSNLPQNPSSSHSPIGQAAQVSPARESERKGVQQLAPPNRVSNTQVTSSTFMNGKSAYGTPKIRHYSALAYRLCRQIMAHPRASLANLENYLERHSRISLPTHNSLPSVVPLNLVVDPKLARFPHLNVLIPGMATKSMSGGPNTAINLTYRLAQYGIPIRYISTDIPMDQDHEGLWLHFRSLTGIKKRYANVEIKCGGNRAISLAIGENDVFFGTAWWTVQMIKHALPQTRKKKFIYLIQEFEPGLYPWSTEYALALETYELDFHAIINESLLAEHLCRNAVGRFAEPQFMDQCVVFEPAVDAQRFRPEPHFDPNRKKKLLFYARPKAPRNLYEVGLLALKKAVERGIFPAAEWDFFSIGESVAPVDLGHGVVLQPHAWLDYEGYSELLRTSDIGLSLMLSPHTSYPPLEMAASGMIVVTNLFGVKTETRLRQLSANILPVHPTLGSIVEGLAAASNRVCDYSSRVANSKIQQPRSWDESFAQVVPKLREMYEDCLIS
jgi:hypothetical protein